MRLTRVTLKELALVRCSPTSFCTTSSICGFINGVDAIGMDNWPFLCFGHGLNGCIQHSIDQLRIWVRSNRPTDDHAVEAIDDRRKVNNCPLLITCPQ
ncbi:hypothetical protein DSM25559_3526 [Agrobacterium rosae]|uniref:Uncharacterized protein n=1 Tax=Agrobacterium rosae TaxID=1972867 RepID=A0A1R3U0E0_9HYPH|nr:hypothetical protein DSM25559_3526 [Agrobacterium rosae]